MRAKVYGLCFWNKVIFDRYFKLIAAPVMKAVIYVGQPTSMAIIYEQFLKRSSNISRRELCSESRNVFRTLRPAKQVVDRRFEIMLWKKKT